MQALTLASTAKPKEVDWEAQCQGILDARRLTAHHMEVGAAENLLRRSLVFDQVPEHLRAWSELLDCPF